MSARLWAKSRIISYQKVKLNRWFFKHIHLAKVRLQVLQSCWESPRTVGEYQLPLTVTFVDFKKAFDSINRTDMFPVLRQCGIPNPIVNAVRCNPLVNWRLFGRNKPIRTTKGIYTSDKTKQSVQTRIYTLSSVKNVVTSCEFPKNPINQVNNWQ